MKYIPLTQGKFAKVDDEDFEWLSKLNWSYTTTGYAQKNHRFNKRYMPIKMHRLILNLDKGQICDHINGDPLDNRKSNLRVCSHRQNLRNTRLDRKNNTSGYKGVFKDKRREKWFAMIKTDGKNKFLGYFANIIDAAKAYDQASLTYHKEFGRRNFA